MARTVDEVAEPQRPKLVAVMGESVASDDYINEYFKGGTAVVDKTNAVKRILGGGTISTGSLTFLFSPSFWSHASAAKGRGAKFDSQSNDGMKLGASLVISCDADGKPQLDYLHKEKFIGDYGDIEEFRRALPRSPPFPGAAVGAHAAENND